MNKTSIIYAGLFVLLGATLGLFLYYLAAGATDSWVRYGHIYMYLLLGYTWFLFILLLIGEIRKPNYPPYDGGKISVLIPCYNEKPDLLEKCIDSVVHARGNKEILVIDDGSTNGISA